MSHRGPRKNRAPIFAVIGVLLGALVLVAILALGRTGPGGPSVKATGTAPAPGAFSAETRGGAPAPVTYRFTAVRSRVAQVIEFTVNGSKVVGTYSHAPRYDNGLIYPTDERFTGTLNGDQVSFRDLVIGTGLEPLTGTLVKGGEEFHLSTDWAVPTTVLHRSTEKGGLHEELEKLLCGGPPKNTTPGRCRLAT